MVINSYNTIFFNAHQGCINLIKNTIKQYYSEILLQSKEINKAKFLHHYSSLQCHMILQKSIKNQC